jgi:hypothetical protein
VEPCAEGFAFHERHHVFGEIDSGHSSDPELAHDAVTVNERRLERGGSS